MEGNQRPVSGGRLAAGYLLGVLVALAAPMVVLSELLSLLPVIMLPSVGVALLYRWFGSGPALCSAVLQVLVDVMVLGGTGAGIAVCMTLLPLIALAAAARRPFFEQLCIAIAAFALGVLLAAAVLYSAYGGNSIERALRLLPDALRALPPESLDALLASLPAEFGSGLTADALIERFEEAVAQMIPIYTRNLPGMIFSGALVTALICAPALAQARGSDCAPFQEWALPASATGGLLLILVVSYILGAMRVRGAEVAFQAVFDVAVTAFCAQALASMARRMNQDGRSAGWQRGTVAVIGVLAYFGASQFVALYGCASAIFGSRGALSQRQRRE